MTLHSYVRTLTLSFHSISFPAALSNSLLQTPPNKTQPLHKQQKKKATKCFRVVESKRREEERTQGNETPTTPPSTRTHTHTHTQSPLQTFSYSPSKCATLPSPYFHPSSRQPSPPRPSPICWNQPCGPRGGAIPCDPTGEAIYPRLPRRLCGPPLVATFPRFPPSRSPSSQ